MPQHRCSRSATRRSLPCASSINTVPVLTMTMKRTIVALSLLWSSSLLAQKSEVFQVPGFTPVSIAPVTAIKNQGMSGTCWCFSATSMLESEALRKNNVELDLSEAFTVRNIYMEKAKNYVLRQGKAQFSEGGLGHDLVRAVAMYGAMPDAAYPASRDGKGIDHQGMFVALKRYVDSIVKLPSVDLGWMMGYEALLDKYMGHPPASFGYEGKTYTPVEFAKSVMRFDASDYISLTSFTHQPYYKPFVVQVPDNFSNGSYYNLPLDELTAVTKAALRQRYSITWDADVSNGGFQQGQGFALFRGPNSSREKLTATATEDSASASERQRLYETLITQDDHLMHLVGIERSAAGKEFFLVKNSWGSVGPFKGYILVSEPYFRINTITLVVPKAGLPKELLAKLKL
ncbi:MAG: aminopeptidase [Chitinophagaceae bacterium]|nr:MAG: aminopeptidase [Chitinophagaceae bacterium]